MSPTNQKVEKCKTCPSDASPGRSGLCIRCYARGRRRRAGVMPSRAVEGATFQVNTRLPEVDKDRLDEVATRSGVTVYQVLRELVCATPSRELARVAQLAKQRISD